MLVAMGCAIRMRAHRARLRPGEKSCGADDRIASFAFQWHCAMGVVLKRKSSLVFIQ